MSSVGRIIVTIEEFGRPVRLETWRGPSSRVIRAAVRARYPHAVLSFGRIFYVNSYGAH